MFSYKDILKEIENLPVEKLEDVYHYVQAINSKEDKKISDSKRKKILSYSGILSDMSEKDYADFVSHTKEVRKNLISRKKK